MHRCDMADDQGQPCSAADYNLLFDPTVPVGSPTTLSTGDRADLDEIIANNEVVPEATRVTPFDSDSVMNYCSDRNDGHPTAYDLLGMEVLYPLPTGHRLACGFKAGCFNTGDGVVVRENGDFTSQWTARGALDISMGLAGVWRTFHAATSVPAGTTIVNFQLLDPRRTSVNGSGRVTRSNSVHAALVSAGVL